MGRKVPSPRARINATRNPRDGETDLDRSATLQLVIALARALKEIDKWVRPHLARQGLGVTEFAVLEVLYHKAPLPLGEIRDQILVTGASTTYIVKKLEQRGLMRRRRSGEDQRRLDAVGAAVPFKHGCRLGFSAACENLSTMAAGAGTFAAGNSNITGSTIDARCMAGAGG